jgi:hypothetical protein
MTTTRMRAPAAPLPASLRRLPALGAALAAATTLLLAGGAATADAAPAPADCSSAGGGKYNCTFYTAGDGKSAGSPVKNSGGQTVGYLHKGVNYVYCQRTGSRVSNGSYYNDHWAYTDSDTGPSGWVNAVYASGGDNDGAFGGGTPDCGNAHGQPPGGSAAPGQPTPAPSPTPTPEPQPVPQPRSCGSTPGSGNNVTRWRPVVTCVLGMLGQPVSDDLLHAIDILIEHESSGNPNAINLTDSNAQAGHPSRGLIQTIPTTFVAHRSQVLPDNIVDPAANLYAGLNYGIDRYGSVVDIPGIDNVLHGRPYVGYAAGQTKGLKSARRCRTLHVGRTLVRYRAGGAGCSAARSATRSLSRSSKVRRVKGLANDIALRTGSREWVCVAQSTGKKRVVRTAVCESGPRDVWFQITPRTTRRKS